ncbi:MAG: hypothetical protein ACE37D_19245, partial [Pseudomonadales bacterium]
ANYAALPSYQAMFEREGANGPGDVALVGTKDEVREAIALMAQAGTTDFSATVYAETAEEKAATFEFLSELAAA